MLSDEQRTRIEYLLYECPDDASFAVAISHIDSSLELHAFAEQYNWDSGTTRLEAILNHPCCDRGTALMIYWFGDPVYFAEVSSEGDVPRVNREGYGFLKRAESLLRADHFQYNQIRFDPTADLNVVQRRRLEKDLRIPDILKKANF